MHCTPHLQIRGAALGNTDKKNQCTGDEAVGATAEQSKDCGFKSDWNLLATPVSSRA